MNLPVGMEICSLVLASRCTYVSVAATSLNLVAWIGFTGWACHFAVGGGAALLGLLVGIIALFMVLQAHLPLLSFIPGAFLGAGTWFGATAGRDGAALTGANVMVIRSMVIGAFLRYLNKAGGKKLSGSQ